MDKREDPGWKVLARSKSKDKGNQKDTVNLPINTPGLNPNNPSSEFTPITPEDRFKFLRDFLKSERPISAVYADGLSLSLSKELPLLSLSEYRRGFGIFKPIAIKIMESGIFFARADWTP